MYRTRIQVGCTDAVTARYDGKDINVAVLDTGICRHPDFQGRIAAFIDFVNYEKAVYDDSGHGTHVAGCLAGDGAMSEGKYRGIAPRCRLYVVKVLNQNGDGQLERMLQGIDWVIREKDKEALSVLNISVGIGSLQDERLKERLLQKIEEAWDCGLIVVVAAGNNGPRPMSLSPMGACRKVITVGCNEAGYFGPREDLCEHYSGRGPSPYALKKPDLVAPGTDIISCNAAIAKLRGKIVNAYRKKSGTSMATPIVAGAAVLARQRFPSLSNEQIKQRMIYTATDLREPWTKQGWGMVHVERLLQS